MRTKSIIKATSLCLTLLMVFSFLNGCTYVNIPVLKSNTDHAILSWSKGNHEQAIHYAQKALEKNPKDTYAMMVAGLSYERLGYADRARPFFEKVAASDTGEVGVFGSMMNVPDEALQRAAMRRLSLLGITDSSFVTVDPKTNMASFQSSAVLSAPKYPSLNAKDVSGFSQPMTASPSAQMAVAVSVEESLPPIRGGLDMLEEGDLNVVMRFITFEKLREEKFVTQEEWEKRRSVNLGGLLLYTLPPAAQGLDLPAPSAEVIIERLNALRQALEIRAITPREHAAEREVILEALLPVNPFYRMGYPQPAEDILGAATALRRVEMLKNLKLITPTEAEKESKIIETQIYKKLGMKK